MRNLVAASSELVEPVGYYTAPDWPASLEVDNPRKSNIVVHFQNRNARFFAMPPYLFPYPHNWDIKNTLHVEAVARLSIVDVVIYM